MELGFFSWESLTTLQGAAFVVFTVSEALRGILGFSDKTQKIVILVMAMFIMGVAKVNADGLDINLWGEYLITVINAIFVALAATGGAFITDNYVADKVAVLTHHEK
jgi:hypothetical protein